MTASAPRSLDSPAAVGFASIRGALLLAVALWLPMVLLRSAWPVDETRYADVALAMQESGQWWVPVLHQKWYVEKPPLFFWAIAGLARLGLPIERGPMAVSLLASLATIALLPAIGRACGLAASSVRRGALVFVLAPLVAVYAQLGYIDPLLTAAVTAAVACALKRSTLSRERVVARVGFALLEGGLLAAGLLTKGPVVLLFAVGLRIGACFAARGSTIARAPGRFVWLDLLTLGVAVALALAWTAKARAIAGEPYLHDLIFGQLERRIAGTEKKHHQFPGFALLVIVVGGLPWSVLALGALRKPSLGGWRPSPRIAGLLGVGVVPSVLLALLPTQQPHYVLPALPALALLAGERLGERFAGRPRIWARRCVGAVGVWIGASLVAAAGALALCVPVATPLCDDWLLQGVLATAGATVLMVTWLRGRAGAGATAPTASTALTALTAPTVATVAVLLLLPVIASRVDRIIAARDLLAAPAIREATRIVAPTGLRSSLRLATRLPRIEGFERKLPLDLLREDPSLIAIVRADDAVEQKLAGVTVEVARGWFKGRCLVALRAAP